MANIFFDFDDVLFNTRDFSEGFRGVFYDHGVGQDVYSETYEASRHTTPIANYNFDEHLSILEKEHGVDAETLRLGVEQYLGDMSMYVFSDVVSCFERLKNAGHRLFLISYGKPKSWQDKKVAASGLGDYFLVQAVGEIHKGDEVARILADYPSEENFFVDDRCAYLSDVKDRVPGVQTVLMQRKEGRHGDVRSDLCDHVATDLSGFHSIVGGIN